MALSLLKKVIVFLILLLGSVCVGKGWHWAKDGFHIQRIGTAFSILAGNGTAPTQEAKIALQQPYFYFGRGRQTYAFLSLDGKYVLKIARLDSYRLPFWLAHCPFSFLNRQREMVWAARQMRFKSLLRSFRLAADELSQETGVLYAHTDPTPYFRGPIQIKDRFHRTYTISLDRIPFVLQKKQMLIMPAVERSIREGRREEAKRLLKAFLDVVAERAKKGIFDKDAAFFYNFGFDGDKGYEIDIGTFYRKKSDSRKSEIETSFKQSVVPVSRWLSSLDPEIRIWFDCKSSEILETSGM